MGTTDQGYSVYTQVIHGGRISLMVALAATVIAMTISIVLGLLAAYKGGLVDDVINLAANVFIVIPDAAAPDRDQLVPRPHGTGDDGGDHRPDQLGDRDAGATRSGAGAP